jgi:hypothetical protein
MLEHSAGRNWITAGEILRVSVVRVELSRFLSALAVASGLKILTETRCSVGCAKVNFSYDQSGLIAILCLVL